MTNMTDILSDAVSFEQISHDIEKNFLSIEYLEQTLQFTSDIGVKLESGDVTLEQANDILSHVVDELSLERTIFQEGSPVYRIIAAIKKAVSRLVDKTKELFTTLLNSRGRLLKKAQQIRTIIKEKTNSDYNVGSVNIGQHTKFMMLGDKAATPLDVIDALYRQSNAATIMADMTNKHIEDFERIVERGESDLSYWTGDSNKLDELFGEYLDRLGYSERRQMIAGLSLDEKLVGAKEIFIKEDVDRDGKFISSLSINGITSNTRGNIESLDRRSALNLCDSIISYLGDDRVYSDARRKLTRSMGTYKTTIDKMYTIFYQSGMTRQASEDMMTRVRSIIKRDLCKDVVRMTLDIDRNLYRVSLAGLIWIDKSLKDKK